MKRNPINNIYFKQLLLFIWIPILTGCEEIIEFNKNENERKLVINTIINASDSIQELSLSVSYPIFQTGDDNIDWEAYFPSVGTNWPPSAEDYPIDYTVNDEEGGLFYDYGLWLRTPNLSAGDKLSLRVSPEILETATGEEYVPEPPVILSVDTSQFTDNEGYTTYMRTLITLKDEPVKKNYYRLFVRQKYYHENGNPGEGEFIVVEENYFIDQDIALNSLTDQGFESGNDNLWRIFSDDLFQGKEYTLNVYFPLYYSGPHSRARIVVEIELQALTESLFLYMRSIEQNENRDVFSQPVAIHSNIRGGYGILGICNPTTYEFTIPPIRRPW